MFSYIDSAIRAKLENDQRLIELDGQGRVTTEESVDAPSVLKLLGPIPMPRLFSDGNELTLHWYVFVRRVELGRVLDTAAAAREDVTSGGGGEAFRDLLLTQMSVNSVLVVPGFEEVEVPLVRVHSCCMTGDVFGSRRCECGPQLDEAFEQLRAAGGGAVVYMSGHEGRGIGLWAKAITYLLQDDGQDTYQANVSLGLPEDSRDFHDAAIVLRYLLRGRPLRLLSNNPLKREHLEEGGVEVQEVVPLVTGICAHNQRYMHAKHEKGHLLPDDI
ncbi:MAG: GTP cyclohydrolase II [Deltaproteobacteria bacterium]|nr:GTP cyclohydrolase II [Deltaproteobacteria bacterium]